MGSRKHLARPRTTFTLQELVAAVQAERDRCATLAREFHDRAASDGMIAAMHTASEIETLIRNQK